MILSDYQKVPIPGSLPAYSELEKVLETVSRKEYLNICWLLARADLYFLLRYVLSTKDYFGENNGIARPEWIFDRAREIQFDSDRIVDVWARFHWKSNLKTFANIIRHILMDPSVTICILSHTRPHAKRFLSQVQREIQSNAFLKLLSYDPDQEKQIFPDDIKALPRNSLDEGIIVNRPTNPREPTLSGHGLVDSLPVGPHFKIRAYDDVVTKDSVATPEMLKKTNQAYELSLPLGMPNDQAWYTGTFYSHNDTYHHIVDRGANLRIHPCYSINSEKSQKSSNGTYYRIEHNMDDPVLYTAKHLKQLFREMGAEEGSATADMQMLCNPNAGLVTGFRREWLRYYHNDPFDEAKGKNTYILVDPANEKKKYSSYTAIWVVACGADRNYYAVEIVRDRLNLTERSELIFELHNKWNPLQVRYEKYAFQADIQHIEYLQERRGYRFEVIPVGGIVKKDDRIQRLLPLFKDGRFFLPVEYYCVTNEGEEIEMVKTFISDEYLPFPNSQFKDMLDALSRICEPDLPVQWPDAATKKPKERYRIQPIMEQASWMGA
jgi:phage terminase large subunit-like protein